MIYLVRHGRTALNAAGLLQGRVDEPIDEVGVRQLTQVGERLAVEAPGAAVISSPLLRARQSSALLASAVGVSDVDVDERWIELDYGVFDAMPVADVPPDIWQSWRTDPEFRPEGGESFAELDDRVHQACDELAVRFAGADVIVVSHVSPIKSAVAWSLGADPAIAHRSRLGQAAICRIDISRNGPVLVSFNEGG